jgi:hypothetical protein
MAKVHYRDAMKTYTVAEESGATVQAISKEIQNSHGSLVMLGGDINVDLLDGGDQSKQSVKIAMELTSSGLEEMSFNGNNLRGFRDVMKA